MQAIQKTQKAIYTLLKAQTTGELANINGVFHYTSQETNFPYVHIGEGKFEEISDFKNEIFKVNTKINIFDRSKSNSTVMILCDEIRILLVNIYNLSVENYSVLDCRHKECKVSLNNDGKTWKGEMIFEVIVKKS